MAFAVVWSIISLSALAVFVPAKRWQNQQLPVHCERRPLEIQGVVEGLVHPIGGDENPGYRFDVQVLRISPLECRGPRLVRVYVNARDVMNSIAGIPDAAVQAIPATRAGTTTDGLLPGALVILEARLRRPWGRVNPGAQSGEKSFLVAGIHGVGSASRLQLPAQSQGGGLQLSAMRDRMRDAISKDIQHRVPGEIGTLLAALAVGDRRAMTPEVWERLRVFGMSHLLVISGMHISLLAVPGWYLGLGLGRWAGITFRPLAPPRLLAAVFAMLTAGSYGLLSGFALPAQRAVLMLFALLLPTVFARALTAGRALPIAGVALFALNPLSIVSASYWLTLGAVAFLLWHTGWRGRGSWIHDLGSAQGFMLLAMLPLSLFWFGTTSSIGAVINLVAIPLITVVVLPLLLGFMLFLVIHEGLASLQLSLAADVLSQLWTGMVHWEPLLVQWSVVKGNPGPFTLVLFTLCVLLLPLPPSLNKALLIVLLLSPVGIPLPRQESDSAELIFFDVGQGTSVLLRHREHALLYDTGGGAPGGPAIAQRSVLPGIHSLGVDTLDTLVISHPDRDHSAGEQLIKGALRPRRVRHGVTNTPSVACRTGAVHRLGAAVMVRYLSQRLVGDSANNASCVVLLSVYGRNILLAGDIDASRERSLLAYWGRDLKADILLAGHHGSASSNSRLWLRSLAPKTMVVTAGRANRFGHPAPGLLDTAAQLGISVINTATHGAVTFTIAPDGTLRCKASRNTWQAFWRRGAFPRDCLAPRSVIRGYNQSLR